MAEIRPALIDELLSNFRKDFDQAFRSTNEKDEFIRFVTEISSTTAANTYNWLTLWPKFQEWIKGNSRTRKSIKAFAHKITNKKFESTVDISAEDIEDDNIGYLSGLPQSYVDAFLSWRMEQLAALLKNGFTNLCYDGQPFFDTEHPVYPNRDGTGTAQNQSNIVGSATATGTPWFLLDLSKPLKPFLFQKRRPLRVVTKDNPATSDVMFDKDVIEWGIDFRGIMEYTLYHLAVASKEGLTKSTYEEARQAMRKIKRDGLEPMDIKPTHLVVPPDLEAQAKELIKAQRLDGGASNVNYNDVEIVVMNRLD